jgi:hypothetical protein
MNIELLQQIKNVEIPQHISSRIFLNIQSTRHRKLSVIYVRRVAAIFILFLIIDMSAIVYYQKKHQKQNDSNNYIELAKNQIYNE